MDENGTTYGIRTGPQELALIGSGALAADRARRGNRSISEKVPTDKGVADFDADGLDALFEAVRSRRAAIMERMEQLQQMVSDGTIDEESLGSGWP